MGGTSQPYALGKDVMEGEKVALPVLFCRRVDGLGWFFNRLPKENVEADLHCPCG
jgi:hypothetical protein